MDNFHSINESKKYLQGTPEFATLKSAIATLRKNSKANTLVQQFQKKEESAYSAFNNGANRSSGSQHSALMDELAKDYEKLMTIPEINNYFTASERFNIILNDYIGELNQSLQSEL